MFIFQDKIGDSIFILLYVSNGDQDKLSQKMALDTLTIIKLKVFEKTAETGRALRETFPLSFCPETCHKALM